MSNTINSNYNADFEKPFDFITYNLSSKDGVDFYQKIKEFTDLVLDESKLAISEVISSYSQFLENFKESSLNNVNNIYSNYNFDSIYMGSYYEEYVLEALYLGVLWKLYFNKSINLDPFYQNLLTKLSKLRNEKDIVNSSFKTEIDEIRGPLATKFLFNSSNTNNGLYKDNFSFDFNLKINLLFDYLESIGDYNESLKHLNLWRDFLLSKDEELANSYINSILSLVNWFEKVATDELHIFTANVSNFIHNYIEDHINKEDILFCGRNELEYYINIFAAEVMNRIFHKSFIQKEKIAILVPVCMRISDSDKCLAIKDDLGFKCTVCSNAEEGNCNIGKIRKKLYFSFDNYNNNSYNYNNKNFNNKNYNKKNYNNNYNNKNFNNNNFNSKNYNNKNYNYKDISVYIVSHSSDILSNISKKEKKELGIIGVACINNLIEGGWKISSYGIPPQCVILNYVGCKKHWSSKDILTDFNFNKLKNIIEI